MSDLKPYYATWDSSDGFYTAEIEERPGAENEPSMLRLSIAFGHEAGFEGTLLPRDAEDLIAHIGAAAGLASFRDRQHKAARAAQERKA